MKRIFLFLLLLCIYKTGLPQNCSTPLRIVVLGSSTARGKGLLIRDSAWTFRYQHYLKQTHHVQDTIINLAIDGNTTHNLMPTGTPAYTISGKTYTVNTNNNITHAIALQPNIIIVNIPWEDESDGFPMAITIANYLAMKRAADNAHIQLWITSTQPREWLGAAGTKHLAQMKDSVLKYFADKGVDFWTPLANSIGTMNLKYSSGSGLYPNAAGQRVLFEQLVAKQIPFRLCTPTNPPPFQLTQFIAEQYKQYLSIKWTSLSELKLMDYVLQRSTDSVNFATLTTVKPFNTSSANYTYNDSTLYQQPEFYRLQIWDSALNVYYSKVIKGTRDIWYDQPFQLSSLTVIPMNGKLQINWSTSMENNTEYFYVQRSSDSVNWQNIGTQIPAAGNSQTTRNYNYTDQEVTPGQTWFYRVYMHAAGSREYYSAGVKGFVPWLEPAFKLNNLTVTAVNDKLQLNWSTSMENNTEYFYVQRSSDSVNWQNIGAQIPAAGNSQTTRNYNYTDQDVTPGQTWFYRVYMHAAGSRGYFSVGVKGTVPPLPVVCKDPIRIVVLGSSTAYGSNLPDRDSAWTFRYARYLKANHNALDTLINLAVGGYTTQQIMPDGTPAYNGINVDMDRNITEAISLNPDAIIINMPTNDEVSGFPLTKQRDNFLLLKQQAAQAGIPLWVTTTQPRGKSGESYPRLQNMRDTIFKYFSTRALDFYTGLATPEGYIKTEFNSGDNVHYNETGQAILFNRVVDKYIPDTLCAIHNGTAPMVMVRPYMPEAASQGLLYPNPATRFVILPRPPGESFSIEVYNALGQPVQLERQMRGTRLNVSAWKTGTYFIIINNKHRYKLVKI